MDTQEFLKQRVMPIIGEVNTFTTIGGTTQIIARNGIGIALTHRADFVSAVLVVCQKQYYRLAIAKFPITDGSVTSIDEVTYIGNGAKTARALFDTHRSLAAIGVRDGFVASLLGLVNVWNKQ